MSNEHPTNVPDAGPTEAAAPVATGRGGFGGPPGQRPGQFPGQVGVAVVP